MAEDAFVDQCRAALDVAWAAASNASEPLPGIPAAIGDAISRSVNSETKTYRYVLPTQLLAKHVNPDLDCRSIQAGDWIGAFDARTLCKKVVVPFDRRMENVLGGSGDPYVNNPLRIERVSQNAMAAQLNKEGFALLIDILDYAEENSEQVEKLLKTTLLAVRARMAVTSIEYPTPRRVSLHSTIRVVDTFIAARTGGTRLQAVAHALFECFGSNLRLFERVVVRHVNSADQQTGSVADLDCQNADGTVVLSVEIKDRNLTLNQAEDKAARVRASGISEFIFLIRGSVSDTDQSAIAALLDREFASGHNLYVAQFGPFLESMAAILGESGRAAFLAKVGDSLNAMSADHEHKLAWRDLLRVI